LREFGTDPVSGRPVVAKDGKFGTYVTDGEINASLGRGDRVEDMLPERAFELLVLRREYMADKGITPKSKGTAKKAAAKKTAAKKAPAKKAVAKKAPAKKTPAKKSAAKKAAPRKTAAEKAAARTADSDGADVDEKATSTEP
jgi:DNA topoisomerase-1